MKKQHFFFVAHNKDMTGIKVLVTAGPTQEKLAPVRFITNHSTGKMEYAIVTEILGHRTVGWN